MFYIRHMAGRRLTRQARAGRKVRRMGLILPDGRRIKRKGVRGTPIGDEDFFKYEETIRQWVVDGLAEITGPDGRVLNWAVLEAEAAKSAAEDRAYEEASSRLEEAEELLSKAGTEEEEASAEEMVKEAQAQLDAFKMPLPEQGPEDPPDDPADRPPDGSRTRDAEKGDDGEGGEPTDMIPPAKEPGEDSEKGEAPADAEGEGRDEAPTETQIDESPEVTEAPEETGASDEEVEEYTKSDLLKMRRSEVDAIAVENGLDPEEYSNQKSLVEALLNQEE